MWNKGSRPKHLELVNPDESLPAKRTRLLGQIRQQALSRTEGLLAHLFTAADDLFYDLSSRASSDAEQNLYFDAMRTIRMRQESFAQEFAHGLAGFFRDLADPNETETSSASALSHADFRELSLVEGEDLELELTRNNMVGRARNLFKEELFELVTRLEHLFQTPMTEQSNPLDPLQIATVFMDTCRTSFDLELKAQLILYKLFERHMLNQLGHLYADANQSLVDAGILVKVPKFVVHPDRDSEIETAGMSEEFLQRPETGLPRNDDVSWDHASLSSLLAQVRELASRSPGAGSIQWHPFSTNPGPVMPLVELNTRLSERLSAELHNLVSTGKPQNIVIRAVQEVLQAHGTSAPRALHENTDNVINLVALFFDRVLQDENLPMSLQSLLGRLQLPVLKVALQDEHFFANPDHPIRRLINRMTHAGLGFDDGKSAVRDPLYRKMGDIVQTLSQHQPLDIGLIAQLDQELEQAVAKEERKSSIVEQRTAQTEAGKSRIKVARCAAQSSIYQKLKDVNLPASVRDFLTTYWLQVMVITHLKQGGDSAEWTANEQTVTDLVWICNRHEDIRSLQRRDRLRPELLDHLEQGLEAAIDDPAIRRARVERIARTLDAIHDSQPNTQAESFAPLSEEQKTALGKGENAPKSWQEMTAVERQQTHFEELSSRFFEQSLTMAEGTWLAYYDEDQDKVQRCKLVSKIDPDAYIFVNRFGFKVLEKTRKQFAYDLQFERALILDLDPFFDRVMNQIVQSLPSPTA